MSTTPIFYFFLAASFLFFILFNATMGARRDASPRYFIHEPIQCNSCHPVLFFFLRLVLIALSFSTKKVAQLAE